MARTKRMYGEFPSDTWVSQVTKRSVRRCNFCGEVKDLVDDFPKNGRDANGDTVYRFDCKVCYNIRRQENSNKKSHSDFIGGQKRRGESEPSLSHQEWKEAMLFFGGECCYCGCTPKRNQRLTRDHLLPISKGGTTTQDNIVPACSSCNSSKGAEDFKDWFFKQSFFSQERLNKIFKWRTIIRQIGGE